MSREWSNVLAILFIIIGLIIVGFFVYLWNKVYTIKGIVYCVYDDRDVYENMVIGSKDECESWIAGQMTDVEEVDNEILEHYHVTLYFDWKFKRKLRG